VVNFCEYGNKVSRDQWLLFFTTVIKFLEISGELL
jgi:hypothetical protein